MHIHRTFAAGVGLAALATSAFAQSAPSADETAELVGRLAWGGVAGLIRPDFEYDGSA